MTNRSPDPVTVTVTGARLQEGRVPTADHNGPRALPVEPTDEGMRFTAPAESWTALSS